MTFHSIFSANDGAHCIAYGWDHKEAICATRQKIKNTITLGKKEIVHSIFQSGWKRGMILGAWTNPHEMMPYNYSLVNRT